MGEGRLIVVSNRLPLSLRRGPSGWVAEPSSGGLASALGPILKDQDTRAFFYTLMQEVVTIGRVKGVPIPADYADIYLLHCSLR